VYQIDINKYLKSGVEIESIGISSKEAFNELMRHIEEKFSDSKIDWESFMNRLSTGEQDVYEIDLMQKVDERMWSMIEHYEFIKKDEIVTFLRSNAK